MKRKLWRFAISVAFTAHLTVLGACREKTENPFRPRAADQENGEDKGKPGLPLKWQHAEQLERDPQSPFIFPFIVFYKAISATQSSIIKYKTERMSYAGRGGLPFQLAFIKFHVYFIFLYFRLVTILRGIIVSIAASFWHAVKKYESTKKKASESSHISKQHTW